MGRFFHFMICMQGILAALSVIERSSVIVGHIITSEPQFDNSTVNVTVISGTTAKLPCEVQFKGDTTIVVWMNPQQTVLTKLEQRIINDMRISVERQIAREWNLHIRNIKYEDRGEYTCSINTHPVRKKTVFLDVLVPTKIVNKNNDRKILVREGEKVELTCNATGVPPPVVNWYKLNEHDQYANNVYREGEFSRCSIRDPGEILVIHNVSRFCDGTFECEAQNGVGRPDKKQTKIEVVFPPEVTLKTTRIGQVIGKETLLQCIINASPLTSTSWKRNGKEITNVAGKLRSEGYSDSTHMMTLNLQISDIEYSDYGVYSCYARNRYGEDYQEVILYQFQTPIMEQTTETSTRMSTTPSTNRWRPGDGASSRFQKNTAPNYVRDMNVILVFQSICLLQFVYLFFL